MSYTEAEIYSQCTNLIYFIDKYIQVIAEKDSRESTDSVHKLLSLDNINDTKNKSELIDSINEDHDFINVMSKVELFLSKVNFSKRSTESAHKIFMNSCGEDFKRKKFSARTLLFAKLFLEKVKAEATEAVKKEMNKSD